MAATNWLLGSFKKSVHLALAVGFFVCLLALVGIFALIVLGGFVLVILIICAIDAYVTWDIKRKLRETHGSNSNS